MPDAEGTILTDRQIEVVELRERGYTQKEVAEELGTTGSNVSAIERSAKNNVEKARQTLRLMQTIQSPVRFTVPRETTLDTLVDQVYSQGDETGIKISYCRPELYSHLYNKLEANLTQNRLTETIEIGLTEDGEVNVLVSGLTETE